MEADRWPDGADAGAMPELAAAVEGLRAARERWRQAHQRAHDLGVRDLPSAAVLGSIVERLRGALFPMRLGPPELRPGSEDFYVGHTLDTALRDLLKQVRLELHYQARHGSPVGDLESEARRIVRSLCTELPVIRALLVPALMRLLGNANWWMPSWTRTILLLRRPPGRAGLRPELTGRKA